MHDGGALKSERRPSSSANHSPPRNAGATPRHHGANLARTATLKNFRNITIGEYGPWRDEHNDVEDSFLVILASPIHGSSLASVSSAIGAIERWPRAWAELSDGADTVNAMDSWHELPRAAFDLETTGRNPLTARIVTASVILVDGRGNIMEHHEWLANPGVPIPEEAAAIHGVSTETAVSQGAPAGLVVEEIAHVLAGYFRAAVPVLAFNARYDFTVLAFEGIRHGVRIPRPHPVLDPYVMDKHADRYRPGKRTLTAMCAHYGVDLENAHTSAADVMATLGVGAVLAERFAQLRRPADHLHESQVTWALRQAASFQEYLRRTDPGATVEGQWPAIAS